MITELQEAQKESIRLMQENAASMTTEVECVSGLKDTEKMLLNARYGVLITKNMNDTTEARLKGVRESMTFTRAKNTIRRTGWYFTEPFAPCGGMET